ncbi:ArsR/SmtB family transcription factor [Alkalicoccus urumqiensis]|uniref:Transcriptional regulator n=1 Tax=Alkalicoccus urumqiensis TaxID=1548213 RepID=A0A2P6MLG7_ALKUR|nr:metalloregulator ArsR/SmtB family transcription factor [Alkalicoccus urumqiensis]PRO67126.1 transcriptional regulator [Alkalicoccus urumqiensis]
MPKEIETCDVYCYNEEHVNGAKELLAEENLSAPVRLFKALADEKRASIAYALAHYEELCVCDLANILHASTATTSHHLRTLYKQDIVTYRKEGKLAFYSLDDDHIRQLILTALAHTKEGVPHD